MKTVKGFFKALRVKPIYAESFANREDVFFSFQKAPDADIQICYASYETPPYEGYALVVYYRKSTKKYYEANGSHCSCYGLEGQWDGDEEIVMEELVKRNETLKKMFAEYSK